MARKSASSSDVSRLLIQWDNDAQIETSAGIRKTRARGEAVLRIFGDHAKSRGVAVERFGLAANGVEARKGYTGTISVTGKSSGGSLKLAARGSALRVSIECDINYESLDRAQGKQTETGCYYIPAVEPAVTVIEGTLASDGKQLVLRNARIHVACAAGGFEEIHALVIAASRMRLARFPGPQTHYRVNEAGELEPVEDSNSDANICIEVTRRRLHVQPVGFRDSAADPSPSGGTAAAQLGEAQTVWGKACIDIDIRPTTFIDNAMLKTSSDIASIRAAFTDPDPNVIEVFFVNNSLPGVGGGIAGGIGVASCKPVIAEPNGGNPVLVSHELGHVLGLLHPGPGSNSDAGTVMAPTGSAMVPGTDLVTHFMCINIATPVLESLGTMCCLTHDIGNHYIRDFPVDVGNEPSDPLPAGMNRYAMSNIWNRLTNTPGTFSASTGPEHEQPIRFNADMTAYTNYLFVTVEQLVNLKVRNAFVDFYLKTPGSGGGAANLNFIGTVAVPDALGVGTPQTVSMSWTVPTGTPSHSCVFGVVRSDAEPAGDQSSLDWWQFEDLSHTDNDWAQRNLDIEDFGSGNVGDSNVESAPFIIHLPPKELRPRGPLVLAVDARAASGLKGLAVEIVGRDRREIKPGGRSEMKVMIGNQPDPLVVVLHGIIPSGLKTGRLFNVTFSPRIGTRQMVGFASVFRIGGSRQVTVQSLDAAAGAFHDLAELFELESAHVLRCRLRGDPCSRPFGVAAMAKWISTLERDLVAVGSDIKAIRTAQETGTIQSLEACLAAIGRYEMGQRNELEVVNRFRALCHRLCAAVSLAR